MGILNVTPDSFSDGGRYVTIDRALHRVEQMVEAGVDIVDVGGESTRPGAIPVPEEEELHRVLPVIREIRKRYDKLLVSVDTTKYAVAKAALEEGANLINDVSGLQFEPRLAELAAAQNAGLILMHMKGTPQTMQRNPHYDDVLQEVYAFLKKQITFAQSCGVTEIYADVGIGFGKTVEHNLALLRNLSFFQSLQVPMVLGISRKSIFRALFDVENPEERDLHTLIAHLFLLPATPPIEIIRVHNVEFFSTARKMWELLYADTSVSAE